MKFIITSTIVLFTILSCQNKKTNQGELFKGEMFLKLIDFGTEIYTYPSKDGKTLKDLYETTPESQMTKEQINGKRDYEFLKEKNLIGMPYFNFSENNSNKEFFKVYVDENEFEKIGNINLSEVRDNGEKIKIQFYGERINEFIIKCHSIEKVQKVKGKQQWGK